MFLVLECICALFFKQLGWILTLVVSIREKNEDALAIDVFVRAKPSEKCSLPHKMQASERLVIRMVQITKIAIWTLSMDYSAVSECALCHSWISICPDRKQVFACLDVQLLQTHNRVDECLICHVEGSCDTLR